MLNQLADRPLRLSGRRLVGNFESSPLVLQANLGELLLLGADNVNEVLPLETQMNSLRIKLSVCAASSRSHFLSQPSLARTSLTSPAVAGWISTQ